MIPVLVDSKDALSQAFDAEVDAGWRPRLRSDPRRLQVSWRCSAYANAADTDGEGWPSDLCYDESDKRRSWHFFLIENLAEVLPGMMVPA